ncbi:MAG: hypothetical protein OZ948_02160 [Deltaproteobacteria bacterium]|nr:hypothetical protein [Deltaproteobacteria bacterium]
MAPARSVRSLAPLAALALALALACGARDRGAAPAPAAPAPEPIAASPAPAVEPPAPAAAPTPAPAGPVVTRTVLPDGQVFEAEYGKADQLPTGFPDDVPLYGNARPLSSMAAPDHGTVVNLRSPDPPADLFAWYQEHYLAQGWEIELAKEEHARSTLVARKGNRVSSVVITGVPGATQALLTVAEDR